MRGSLDDLQHLRLAEQPFRGVLVPAAISAQHLDGCIRDIPGRRRGKVLGNVGLHDGVHVVLLAQSTRTTAEFPCSTHFDHRISNQSLDQLVTADPLSELLPYRGIGAHQIKSGLGNCDARPGDTVTPVIEGGICHKTESDTNARDYVLGRNHYVTELNFGDVRRAAAQQPGHGMCADPAHRPLDDKGSHRPLV